ncbi:MAG: MFS transporter [Clostridia bacterium]|nr:MFS transporter [Clostridia bacterium]
MKLGRLNVNLQELKGFSLKRTARIIKDGMLEGWYLKGDPASEDRKRLIMCNYTSNVIANLIGGTFWTGLLIVLNADDSFIGTMSMISTAANMLQCLSPLLLERFPKRRTLLSILRAVLYFINVLMIGLIPLFPVARQTKLYFTGIGVLLVNIINAFIAPGLSIWHVQSLPHKVRRSYFSLITMTVGAVVAICNLLGGWVVDAFTAHDMQYYGLLTLRIVAAVLCGFEIWMYFHIREYPYEGSDAGFKVKDLVTKPFKEKTYLLTVCVTFLWNFTANIPGSYYSVYLLRDVGMSYSMLTLISMINVPIVLFLTPIWRKVLTKFGWFRTLYTSMTVYLVHYLVLALVTKQTSWIYPFSQLLGFIFAVGINLSFTGIPYVNMPEKNQTVFIGFYSTVANFAALLGVTLGKYFILSTEEIHFEILGLAFGNKQLIVVLTACLMCFAVFGIHLISKRVKSDC